jgi:hypothetical protein
MGAGLSSAVVREATTNAGRGRLPLRYVCRIKIRGSPHDGVRCSPSVQRELRRPSIPVLPETTAGLVAGVEDVLEVYQWSSVDGGLPPA